MGLETHPIKGSDILLKKAEPQIHGTVKTDVYWKGDDKGQQITSVATPSVKVGPISASAAVGKDACIDTPPSKERDIADIYASIPINPYLSMEGRARTSHGRNNTTTQFRGGIKGSVKITDADSLYAHVYGASKKTYGCGSTPSFGGFIGINHQTSENTSCYVEAQAYDFNDENKGSVGVNIGFKANF